MNTSHNTKRQRLLIVSGSYPNIRCGVSPHVTALAGRLVEGGEYDVVVLTSDDAEVKSDLAEGYQVYPRIAKWSVGQRGKICDEILALEPEVVNIQNPSVEYLGWNSLIMSAVAPLLKRRAPQVRIVVMQHDIALSRSWLRRRYRPLFRAADGIIVSNSRDYQAVREQKIPEKKIYRAPLSSHIKVRQRNRENRANGRAALGIPNDSICVAYFGYVHPGRNIEVLIRALAMIKEQNKSIHGLIMGGAYAGEEDYYKHCQELACELKLSKQIHWTGYATEETIAQGMAGADVFVSLPQRGADMRNTSILSAMLADLPIVTTHNAKFFEDREMEELGCVCLRKIEPGAVAEAILKALGNQPSSEFLERRREWLEPEAVWKKHVEILLRACRGLPPLKTELFSAK